MAGKPSATHQETSAPNANGSSVCRPGPRSLPGAGRVGALGGVTRVQGLLGGAAVNIHVLVGPGRDAAQRRRAAVGQAGHLCRLQQPVPQVELGQLPDQGLRGVKLAAQCVLTRGTGRDI